MTVTEAFQLFKSELELPDRKQKEAAAAQQEMRDQVSKHLYVANSFLTGSYSRYTKIFPLNDVDVFLVRNQHRTDLAVPGTGGTFPDAALTDVLGAVQKAYPITSVTKKQNRSVNVAIRGHDFGFDLTPTWLRNPSGYWIPDSSLGTWIPSDPDAHATMMTAANERNEGKLKPLIKMAKHWSRNNYDRMCSFHIELICAAIFSSESLDNYQIGMATVLAHLPGYIGRIMMDPIYGVSRVDKELSPAELAELRVRVNGDAGRAIDALRLENAGYHGEAIAKWKEMFLKNFPQ
jgi:hypothetical protein